jgi:predicted ATPase
MLTRLKVNGFKNLVDVDVRFGPFTCIAGANGVGKSNLFDAITFLSALADKTLLEAAKSVRDDEGRFSDIRRLFHRVGNDYPTDVMTFEAEMIVPEKGIDDFGQEAKAKITFLRYLLKIGFRGDKQGGLELLYEELKHINLGEASRHLLFPHKASSWRNSAVRGRRSGGAFISTEETEKGRIIKLHADGEGGGSPRLIPAANLPRTVLSGANAAETPTALMAKREMQSWRLLQLEPSALRKPDDINAPIQMGADGSHLAATLYHLPKTGRNIEEGDSESERMEAAATTVYSQLANRLAELISDVRDVNVEYEEKWQSLTVILTGRDGTPHPARSLSDGTLRFLALATLELDTESSGVICLEEPENGIHPERIPAMLDLLQDIATDTDNPIGTDNPLRQVIVNTHSPAVVAQIPDDSLLVAEITEMIKDGKRFKSARFSCLSETWRENAPDSEKTNILSRGKLLSYLNPVEPIEEMQYFAGSRKKSGGTRKKRVIDRTDLQPCLPFLAVAEPK